MNQHPSNSESGIWTKVIELLEADKHPQKRAMLCLASLFLENLSKGVCNGDFRKAYDAAYPWESAQSLQAFKNRCYDLSSYIHKHISPYVCVGQIRGSSKADPRFRLLNEGCKSVPPSVIDRLAERLNLHGPQVQKLKELCASGDLPGFLLDALEHLDKLTAKAPADHRSTAIADEVYYSKATFTNIDKGLSSPQERLVGVLTNLKLGRIETLGDRDYSSSIYEDLANTRRVMYLFPFYLTPSRRSLFGVLPFGAQRKLGFILPKSHPSSTRWDQLTEAAQRNPLNPQGGAPLPLNDQLTWIARLILDTHEIKGKLAWFLGFSQKEILNNCRILSQDSSIRHALTVIETSLGLSRRHDLPVFTQCDLRLTVYPQNRTVVTFDPGEACITNAGIRDDCRCVVCEHGLDVPVGIGFNLYMLPSLLLDDKWKILLEVARTGYGHFKSELAEIGIEMLLTYV